MNKPPKTLTIGVLADLRRVEVVLRYLVRRYCVADGEVRCPMIQALQEA